ncbi:MAG: hypothetical protein FWE47_03910 [Oscillospiraceae bacterium]|nr:hypothetical protein [Oscillospiraceae bacterium]
MNVTPSKCGRTQFAPTCWGMRFEERDAEGGVPYAVALLSCVVGAMLAICPRATEDGRPYKDTTPPPSAPPLRRRGIRKAVAPKFFAMSELK